MNKGTSQKYRNNTSLNPNYISIDERSMLDLVQFTIDYSENINYYNLDNKIAGDWKPFFLNDPAFIIAMIAATNINTFKINNESISNESHTTSIEEIKKQLIRMINLISYWSTLLKKSDHKDPLLKELIMLSRSIPDKNLLTEKKNKELVHEIYKKVYGNIVFIKEKANNRFTEELINSNHHPHLGLLLSFFKLFQNVQKDINLTTKKHLDYYYLKILEQKRKKLKPHSAIIALELDEVTEGVIINKGRKIDFIFEDNQQSTFETIATTQITKAKIADVRTLYKSDYSPYSNTFDGDDFTINILYDSHIFGNDLNYINLIDKENPNNLDFPSALGEEQMHDIDSERTINLSDIGVVISSPSLILEKGKQKITLTLNMTSASYEDEQTKATFNALVAQEIKQKNRELSSLDIEEIKKRSITRFFREAFKLYITDKNGWKCIDHIKTIFQVSKASLTFIVELHENSETLIPFNPKIHDGGFESNWPCIKLLLNNDAVYHPYKFLEKFIIENITIQTSVSGVSNVALSNSTGELDSSIPFNPFGSTPYVGSYLRIENPIILQKSLSKLQFDLDWGGLPQERNGFEEYYKAYPNNINTTAFKAIISQTRSAIQSLGKQNQQSFELFDADPRTDSLVSTKKVSLNLDNIIFRNQITSSKENTNGTSSPLYIVLSSPDIAFGHQIFSDLYAKAALKSSRFRKKSISLPKQPYTPVLEQLTISYSNYTKEIMLRKKEESESDIKLIHLYPFGHIQTFPGPIRSPSYFLPRIEHKGNLCIGLTNVKSGEIISIGFDLIPAVYMHTIIKKPSIHWEYLSNNEWLSFSQFLLEDGTDGLIRSGVVKIEIPKIIPLDNTRLAKEKFWIRAVSIGKEDLNSKIKNIVTNAVMVTSEHLLSETTTYTNNIQNAKVQKISFDEHPNIVNILGPFDLKMNELNESEGAFYSRVNEQLRHKNRATSQWDYERLVLEKFPQIEKIRVYGRNSHPDELVKGSAIQIVVIPKCNLTNEINKRRNEVAFDILEEIKEYIKQFVSPFAKIEVSNPVYEQLKVRCSVKFTDYEKRGYLRNKLNNELILFLSPDIESSFVEKGFDESISKTEILNFIESRPYVAFVTEFSVLQLIEVQGKYKIIDTAKIRKIESLRTITPYAMLTSVKNHHINIIKNNVASSPKISRIGDLSLASDFVISDIEENYN
ncbi:hypothetical protein AWE51_08885 [Aquimarina aggregata]|uniref:Baseplate protein J-like domain-containing protein n=1 Tax=Aquimarina aggregata TaxID=1642818 RepID=A0A162ZER0_9FLAO|nr:hypothetical protein [Aquimarina aggregata]KZS39755.1 hypothetical protein AWE51_08885 [Aquimarina aggregata]